ncbi:MAG: hypothetical protein RLY20_788 [Verrucomicrobiota bacterium]|jgi:glucose/arabinose dehydrogenase/subtilisin-like proprotein convertase family protein
MIIFRRGYLVWLVTGFLFLLGRVGQANGATVPAGFSETVIPGPGGGSWNEAVGVTFDAVGRMFVWERTGHVWMRGAGATNFTEIIDISEEVGDWGDYGLVGFALDPGFISNGHIYLLYEVDRHHLLYYGTTNYNANANDYNSATIGRLTRYTCVASNNFQSVDLASRLILIGDSKTNGIPMCSNTHGVGSVLFGEDGSLLVTCGDGASANAVDTGGAIPASTAPQALIDGIISPKEDVGAYRSQMLTSLDGKVLRIDPATGNGHPSNPFYEPANPKSVKSRVWALGLRNPFRTVLRPESGSHDPAEGNPGVLYVGEVGWDNWESLKIIAGPGKNMGWPLFEGLTFTPTFSAGGTYDVDVYNQDAPNPLYPSGGCNPFFSFRQLLKQDTTNFAGFPPFDNPCNAAQKIPSTIPQFLHTRPALDWNHAVTTTRCPTFDDAGNATTALVGAVGAPVGGTQFRGNCSVGGTWYTGTAFPPQYQNTYFHADWGQLVVKNIATDANNHPTNVADFMSDAGAVVCITQHPLDGSLYYVSYTWGDAGTVRQLSYTGNRTPVAVASADQYYGPGPLTVQFSSAGSVDPDAQMISYQWNFGDGSPVSTLANPSHQFTAIGSTPTNFPVTLTVTDTGGLFASKTLNIALNDTPPNVFITSPTNGMLYSLTNPTVFNLTASVSDAESPDSQLRYSWLTLLHHNNHNHVIATDTNHTSTTATEPIGCDGENLYYFVVSLTVTDPRGLSTTKEARLFPNCGTPDTPPTISNIPDQATELGVPTAAISFTVGDAQIAAANLQLSATSSNPALVPVSNIAFGGTGANRTVVVTPAPNLNGATTITITVNDGPHDVSDSFVLTVTGSNTPPTISALADSTVAEGTSTAPLNFTVGDVQTPPGSLMLSGEASNPALVPSANIVFGGAGANRTVTVTPVAGKTGNTTISVIVSDGQLMVTNRFALLVTSLPAGLFAATNATPIGGADVGAINPYPSTIKVSDLGGTVSSVTVTLSGLAHTWPDDWDILLVGPGGQQLILMSDVGGGNAITNVNLTFSASAVSFLADSNTLTTGTYLPTDFATGGTWPAPAPSGPYATNLSVFTGQQANGVWSLYVFDGGLGDFGYIVNGWSLAVATTSSNPPPPVISTIADQFTVISTPTAPIPFTVADSDTTASNLVFSAGSSNPTLVPTNNIVFSGSGSNRTVTITPASGWTGTTILTVFANDGTSLAGRSFNFTVATSLPTVSAFTNGSLITIRDTNSALPYPSSINVAGMSGNISNVTVTVHGFNHTWGSDVDVLLVGPVGQNVMLMSDCGDGDVNNVTLTFNDDAAGPVPGSSLTSGTFKPTNLSDVSLLGDDFPVPAPAGPFGSTLSVFSNSTPNGTWSLYVLDDGPGDTGTIAGGWSLTISTLAIFGSVSPPIINSANFLNATQFHLVGTGDANATYHIQASTNLLNWSEIGLATANGSGVFEYIDGAAAGFRTRYYRVTYP